MAATEGGKPGPLLGSIVLAACALPGVLVGTAHAEDAPTAGVIAFKWSSYQDGQTGAYGGNNVAADTPPGAAGATVNAHALGMVSRASAGGGGGGPSGPSTDFKRIRVNTPSMYALVPISRQWAAEGSLTVDDVSGASPLYYTDMRSAAHMVDRRTAEDVKLTHYGDRQTYALGLAHSRESDFLSDAVSAEARLASDDQNTTWNLGLGLTSDIVNASTHIITDAKRHTTELQGGVTQVLSARDLVQATYTLSLARGYMNDPYKFDDARPDTRNANILLLRWNHWLGGSALKTGYRFYKDSYSVTAHTFDVALASPWGPNFTVTTALRYYTQSAASFYANPNASTYPNPVGNPQYFSADQRLAAYGALSGSIKLELRLAPTWTMDGKFETYHQRSNLHLGQGGSPGLNPLYATIWQWGLSHSF